MIGATHSLGKGVNMAYEIEREFNDGFAAGVSVKGFHQGVSDHWRAGYSAGYAARRLKNQNLDEYLVSLGRDPQKTVRVHYRGKLKMVELFYPGEFLYEELEARGWLPKDFSEKSGIDPQLTCDILGGRASIDEKTAEKIGNALGTSAQMWINLQASLDSAKARQ